MPKSSTVGNISDIALLSDERFIRRVARLYHESGKTQEEIAETQNCSRQTVGKALQRAKEQGIVRISIMPEERTGYLQNLARELRLHFRLEDIVLAHGRNFNDTPDNHIFEGVLADIGDTAADYLDQLLTNDSILAISGGKRLMRNLVRYLKPSKLLPGLQVVPTMGFVSPRTNFGDANLITYDISTAYGGVHSWLPIPAIVETQEQCTLARSLPLARDVIKKIESATIIMTGLWFWGTDDGLIRKGVISEEQKKLLEAQRPVADINHWFFNAEGQCINYQLDPPPYYLTGLEIPKLKAAIEKNQAKVILVVGGSKAYIPGIHAILKAGIANILITDHVTAQLLKERIPTVL